MSWEALLQSSLALPDQFTTAMPDDALSPRISRGTVLVFSSAEAPRPGLGVLVEDAGGRRYVRRYVEGHGGQWLAQAVNESYATLESGRDGLRLLAVMTGRMDGGV